MKTRTGKQRQGQRKRAQGERRGVPEAREQEYDPWPELRVGYRGPRRPRPRVPPPESDLWPPQYRGARWKRIYAALFAGKCLLCQYSFEQPPSRKMRDRWRRQDTPLLCTNRAACPGALVEVLATDTCRNFQPQYWRRAARKKAPATTAPPRGRPQRKKGVCRVPLSRGLFATVDAADYPEISKHKWWASCRGNKFYAWTRIHGRIVQMHRFLLRPRQGYVVDHIDGNSRWSRGLSDEVATQSPLVEPDGRISRIRLSRIVRRSAVTAGPVVL